MKVYRLIVLAIVSLSLGQPIWAQNEAAETPTNQAEVTEGGNSSELSEFASIRKEVRSKLSEVFKDDIGENSWGRLWTAFESFFSLT